MTDAFETWLRGHINTARQRRQTAYDAGEALWLIVYDAVNRFLNTILYVYLNFQRTGDLPSQYR